MTHTVAAFSYMKNKCSFNDLHILYLFPRMSTCYVHVYSKPLTTQSETVAPKNHAIRGLHCMCVCVCMCECVYIYIYICICIKYNSRTISCLLSDKFILVLQIILGNYPETLPPWDIYPQDMLLLDKLSKNL